MKTNCELPLDMLKDNLGLNDYDFVLFHLYQSNETYRNYYKQLRVTNPDRIMIFDNSAYEYFIKGETLCIDDFKRAIEDLNPTYYILPDVLMNMYATLRGIEEFTKKGMPNADSVPMAIVQGKNETEMLTCLDLYRKSHIDHIGIPFHNSFYKEWVERSPHVFSSKSLGDPLQYIIESFAHEYKLTLSKDLGILPEDIIYAIGRVDFIYRNKEILDKFDYVHILGSHCPYEVGFYHDFDSMDTGYPVKLGLTGVELGSERKKPNIIIDDFLEKPISDDIKDIIRRNINRYRSYIRDGRRLLGI